MFPDENGSWILLNQFIPWPRNLEFYRLTGSRLTSLGVVVSMAFFGCTPDVESGEMIVRGLIGYESESA